MGSEKTEAANVTAFLRTLAMKEKPEWGEGLRVSSVWQTGETEFIDERADWKLKGKEKRISDGVRS